MVNATALDLNSITKKRSENGSTALILIFLCFQIFQYAYEPVNIRRRVYALVYKDAVS